MSSVLLYSLLLFLTLFSRLAPPTHFLFCQSLFVVTNVCFICLAFSLEAPSLSLLLFLCFILPLFFPSLFYYVTPPHWILLGSHVCLCLQCWISWRNCYQTWSRTLLVCPPRWHVSHLWRSDYRWQREPSCRVSSIREHHRQLQQRRPQQQWHQGLSLISRPHKHRQDPPAQHLYRLRLPWDLYQVRTDEGMLSKWE